MKIELNKYRVYWVVINNTRVIYNYQRKAVEGLGFSAGFCKTSTITKHYTNIEELEKDAANIRQAFAIVNDGRGCKASAAILTDAQIGMLPPLGNECRNPWKVAEERMTKKQVERLATILKK